MPERGTANRFQSLRFVCWEACATRLYLSYDVWVIAETCDARYRSFDGTVACYELKGMGNDYSRPLSLPERGWFELNFLATAYNLLGALLREYNIRDPMSQRHEGQFRNCRMLPTEIYEIILNGLGGNHLWLVLRRVNRQFYRMVTCIVFKRISKLVKFQLCIETYELTNHIDIIGADYILASRTLITEQLENPELYHQSVHFVVDRNFSCRFLDRLVLSVAPVVRDDVTDYDGICISDCVRYNYLAKPVRVQLSEDEKMTVCKFEKPYTRSESVVGHFFDVDLNISTATVPIGSIMRLLSSAI